LTVAVFAAIFYMLYNAIWGDGTRSNIIFFPVALLLIARTIRISISMVAKADNPDKEAKRIMIYAPICLALVVMATLVYSMSAVIYYPKNFGTPESQHSDHIVMLSHLLSAKSRLLAKGDESTSIPGFLGRLNETDGAIIRELSTDGYYKGYQYSFFMESNHDFGVLAEPLGEYIGKGPVFRIVISPDHGFVSSYQAYMLAQYKRNAGKNYRYVCRRDILDFFRP
jgi:hypothetical protein